ncbi:alpha-2,8-sialyltransferase 8F-like isoform X2 [Arapaima gigas]
MRRCYLSIFCLLVLATVVLLMYLAYSSEVKTQGPSRKAPKSPGPAESKMCQGCSERIINKLMKLYSQTWQKQEGNFNMFRSQLKSKCDGISKAIITQANTPLGSKVIYDGEKRKPLQVTSKLLSTFVKDGPFRNQTLETCAVVGNGGILSNSSCGNEINSAQFVIRFDGLMEQRRPFAESLDSYGDSLLLLPAFSYGHNTAVSLRALYTLRDFGGLARPVFLNPEYLRSLARFWRTRGLRAMRLSTGLIVASLALELCTNVHLYGFWPFPVHPHSRRPLTNHYYDDRQSKKKVHDMPDEFGHLMHLHNHGVVRLHLGKCEPTAQ